MPYLIEMDGETGCVSGDVKSKGLELSETYRNGDPFPHIQIDDFLPPSLLELCLSQFPTALSGDDVEYDRDQERYKKQYNPDNMSTPLRQLFYSFNSRPFIKILENLTGIKALIPDPYFLGAGLHEIGQGGHLSVHADFNHHKPMNLERRINVLIYLNDNWKSEYGGQLELWTSDMSRCVKSIVPILNRCVIFNTTGSSYHGNPNPVSHPEGITRKSIALYYYTATWSDIKREKTTQFKVRPGTNDRADVAVTNRELVTDLVPPILLRGAKRLGSKLGRH